MNVLSNMLRMVKRFNVDLLEIAVPKRPECLSNRRKKHAVSHLQEELEEFKAGRTVEDHLDALLDLIYVALGRIIEMGILPGPAFEEVHRANMDKQRGEVEKRPDSGGLDAVKPDNWEPPNFTKALSVSLADLEAISPILLEITRLRAKKGQDYNSSVQLVDYFPLGHASYFHMVHLKTKRIQSLIELERNGGTPNFEGLRDTILDLLNYATFYAEALDRGDLS